MGFNSGFKGLIYLNFMMMHGLANVKKQLNSLKLRELKLGLERKGNTTGMTYKQTCILDFTYCLVHWMRPQ